MLHQKFSQATYPYTEQKGTKPRDNGFSNGFISAGERSWSGDKKGVASIEWKEERGIKQPYFIHLKSQPLFAMAGIWEKWTHADESVDSCSIIT